MSRQIAPIARIVFLLSICLTSAHAGAASKSPQDVLKTKGLTKFGPLYLLDDDLKLTDSLKNIRKSESQVEAYAAKRKTIEDDIDYAYGKILRLRKEIESIDAQMAKVKQSNVEQYNQLVGQVNSRNTAIEQSASYMARRYGDLEKLLPPTVDPIGATFELADRMDNAQKQYDKLAADSEVTAALADLNAANPKMKVRLGPSEQFKSELARLRKQRNTLNATMVKCEIAGGVLRAHTTLNGSTPVTMVVDSGAAYVSITEAVAKQLKLEPKPNDPEVTLVAANGKETKARVAVLDSLRVGPFVAKNVVCAILPESLGDVDCLLGGTFLQNFISRIDIAAGVLHLSPISGQSSNVAVDAVSTDNVSSGPRTPTTSRSLARVTLEISATVDGSETVEVSPDGLKWKHTQYAWPSEVRVNGQTWDLQKSQTFASPEMLKLLQSVDFGSARSIDKKGRGVLAVEPQDNSLVVYFVDIDPGADHYTIKISLSEK